MAEHLIYHWKHGWIPLTHAAALSKAKGNSTLANKYVHGTSVHGDHATTGKSARQIHAGLGAHPDVAHPVGSHVIARQPGIDHATRGVVMGHSAGMVQVAHKDRHSNTVVGTFNPHHVTPAEAPHQSAATPAEVANLNHGDKATVKGMDEFGQPMTFHGTVSGRPTAVRIKQGPNGKVEPHLAVSMHNGTDSSGGDATARTTVYVPQEPKGAYQQWREDVAGSRRAESPPSAHPRPNTSTDSHAAVTAKTETPSTKRVEIEHSGDGTLLTIDRSDSEARAAAKAAGFKFSSNLGQWYLPRNWSEPARRQKVALLQNALGREHVHVADSGPGSALTAAEREAETRSRAADRAVRMDSRAKRAATEADVRFGRAHAIGDMIPFGQPILVGHHSEGRHRRDLARIDTNMRKGFEAHQEAGAAQAAADRARATAAGDSPLLRQRRIDRNEAELRKVEKQLKEHEIGLKLQKSEKYQSVSRNARGMVDSMVASPDYHAQLTARQAELRDQIDHDKSQIEASGHKAIGQADLSPGDLVIYRGSPHVVKKVNKTTISVPTGYSWDDKLPINQITKHVKLADIPTSTIQGALANEKDPKVRHHYIAELNRRGIKATATN